MAGGLHYESLADLPPGMRQQVAGKVAAKAAVTVAGRRESKYHNEPVTVKGIRFDSKKEARRYLQLTDAVREGLISDLRLQQDFTLQEAYTTPPCSGSGRSATRRISHIKSNGQGSSCQLAFHWMIWNTCADLDVAQ